MRTLRELGDFVGVPQDPDDLEAGQTYSLHIRMRDIGKLLGEVSSADERTSLQSMIRRVSNLSPFTLEAELVGPRTAQEPFAPTFRIRPSAGLILSTRFQFVAPGTTDSTASWRSKNYYGAAGGDFTPVTVSPNIYYTVNVWRCGVTATGFQRLVASFSGIRALPQPLPLPLPLPQPPPPPPQGVTCQAEMDLNDPGFGGITNMRIFGGGMQASESVLILEHENESARTNADVFGHYRVTIGFPRGQHPTEHKVYARGQVSNRVSNDVRFTV